MKQEIIDAIKRRIGQTTLTDEEIWAIYVSANENINCAAASVWIEKAGGSGDLIDMQEGSSRRNLSQISAQAAVQARFFQELCDGETGRGNGYGRASRTRQIERP